MHRKNVQGFEGHGVVAAKHILITQEIREIGRQSIPHPFINASRDGSTTEFKPKQLPGVEHLPVVPIPPSVEAVSFIASWYLVVGCKSPHKHLGAKQLPADWSLDEVVYPLPQATPLSVRHPLGR